jgi:thiamine biosynthesis protein ThiI
MSALDAPDLVLIRLGELTLKGNNRSRFEKTVLNQIQLTLQEFDGIVFSAEFGRIYIQLNGQSYDKIVAKLGRVFGISSFSPAYSAPLDLERIQELALHLMKTTLDSHPRNPHTFKISAKRANKSFPHDTQRLNYLVGGYVLQACPELTVDVHHPQIELRVEVREQRALLFLSIEEGAGGYPQRTNGKALLLLSGGIDSPVAGYYALRKGVEVEAIHFHSYPYTSERAKQKVIDLARKLADYTGEITLHLVSFTEVQTEIHRVYQDNLLVTLLRRAMYRIAESIAERQKAMALITGESLGQVASQTLPSMNAIGRVVNLPILQPLIAMEKKEIVRMAERIGTYPISILPYEDCCTLFLPPSPSTNPNLRVLEKIEASIPGLDNFIRNAISGTETIIVRTNEANKMDDLF